MATKARKPRAAKRRSSSTLTIEKIIAKALAPEQPTAPALTAEEWKAREESWHWDNLWLTMQPDYAARAPVAIGNLLTFYGKKFRKRLSEIEALKITAPRAPKSFPLLIDVLALASNGGDIIGVTKLVRRGFAEGLDFPNAVLDLQTVWLSPGRMIGPPTIEGFNDGSCFDAFAAQKAKNNTRRAALNESTWVAPPSEPQNTAFDKLLNWAAKELKGKELTMLSILATKGPTKLEDLAACPNIDWLPDSAGKSYSELASRVNRKLAKQGYRILRHNNTSALTRTTA